VADDAQGSTFLARIALEWRLIRREQLDLCLREQEAARAKGREVLLGRLLLDRGWIRPEDLKRVLEEQRRRLEEAPALTRYEFKERVGEGATAVVYHARDRQLDRPVALKLLREEVSLDPLGRERFRREVEALKRLSHPNVVALYDAGEAGGRLFLVMELVRGRPLSEILRRRRPDEREAVDLVEKAARGVGAAHAVGIVHRDLKPSNLLVLPMGEPKVADFGLVRLADSAPGITRGGALGSPMYMAPEQISGKAISPRTDVFSLGAILYEMLTGAPPHAARTEMAVYKSTLLEPPAPPSSKNPRLDPGLEALVLGTLQKDPARRLPDADALADALAEFQRR
jgi:serine/threonine-protein kinase